jgi:hypothetical protein
MAAITKNIYIEQGVDFTILINVFDVNGTPLDLTGAVIYSQIKQTNTGNLIGSFSYAINIPLSEIILNIPATESQKFTVTGSAKWDIFLEIGSYYSRLLQGDCYISQAQSSFN